MENPQQFKFTDAEHLDAVFGAVGGGGLVAGICEYVKRIGSPRTRVIGVETIDGDAMARSLEKGERITLPEVGPFSDGTAVRIVDEEPFRVCRQLLDGAKTYSKVRLVAWGKASSFSSILNFSFFFFWCVGNRDLAGLKKHILDNQLIGSGKKFVVVISEANMNFDRLRFVAERAELGESREALLSVDIPERPGRYGHARSSCHRALFEP
jgi:threonine dehydratase